MIKYRTIKAVIDDVRVSRVGINGDNVSRYHVRATEADTGYPYPGPTVSYTLMIWRGKRPDGRGGSQPYLGGEGTKDCYLLATLPHRYIVDGVEYVDGQGTTCTLMTELVRRVSERAIAEGEPERLVLREAQSATR